MSDTVLITLIVAATVIILLFMFRRQLSRFGIKANKEGIEAELETRDPSAMPDRQDGVIISGAKQFGKEQVIDVGRENVTVEDTRQVGTGQKIIVRPDPTPGETKQ